MENPYRFPLQTLWFTNGTILPQIRANASSIIRSRSRVQFLRAFKATLAIRNETSHDTISNVVSAYLVEMIHKPEKRKRALQSSTEHPGIDFHVYQYRHGK